MQELSRALPIHFYRDPAKVVEQNQLTELGCKACEHHGFYLGKSVCHHVKVKHHNRVPSIGSKCKFFQLRG